MKQSVKSAAWILILLAAISSVSCDDGGGSKDSTPWDAVTLTGAAASLNSIDISWRNPSNGSFDHLEISWSADGETADTADADRRLESHSITGLDPSTEYTVTLTAVHSSGSRSENANRFSVFTTGGGAKAYCFIYTVADLNAVRGGAGGHETWGLSGNYILMADLDLNVAPYNTGTGWAPIGGGSGRFTGIFNGNNHAVRNLFIDDTGDYRGLFGYIHGAYVCGLGLESVDVAGGENTGGIAGYSNGSTLTNCYVTGAVAGSYSTGGLVGFNLESGLTNCYSAAAVSGSANGTGGLAGSNSGSDITDCYATGPVSGADFTGGLVGWNAYGSVLTNCYATGKITVSISTVYKGGLAGYDYLDTGTFASCYYDSGASGQDDTGKGEPRTTGQMKLEESSTIYVGWDFAGETENGAADVWAIDDSREINSGYPYLRNNHR